MGPIARTVVVSAFLVACGGSDPTPVGDDASVLDGPVTPDAPAVPDAPGMPDAAPPDANRPGACGDGVVDVGFETCDDGNGQVSDACPDGPLGTCMAAVCGDGFVWAGIEQCDDANSSSGDGCSSICILESTTCGNGVVEPGEACDNGAANSDTADGACRTSCVSAGCGDFVVDYSLGEHCDDGNTAAGDGCGPTCQIEAPPTCGDGTLDLAFGEQCDDGNTAAGDGCSPTCQFETVGAMCGNGVMDPGEVCDDGNTTNGDSCNPTCNLANSVTTYAGMLGMPGGLDGVGTGAQFSGTAALTVDDDDIWVADGDNFKVRRIDIATATVTTVAGNGVSGFSDSAVGLSAQFGSLSSVATDGYTLWLGDQSNHVIRAIDLTNPLFPVTTVAGQVGVRGNTDGVGSAATLDDVRGLTYYAGLVWSVDACQATLRRFDPTTNNLVTVAGSPLGTTCAGGVHVDGYGSAGTFVSPRYMASDNSGVLYVSDTNGNTIRAYNTITGYLGTYAGDGTCGYVDGIGTAARPHRPRGMTSDGTSVYWVEFNAHTIRQGIFSSSDVSTLAGTPPACSLTCSCGAPPGGSFANGTGSAALFDNPWSMAFHFPSNSLFVVDGGNAVIRRIQ